MAPKEFKGDLREHEAGLTDTTWRNVSRITILKFSDPKFCHKNSPINAGMQVERI